MVCVHTYSESDNMKYEIWPFEVFQDGRRWIRRPRKPHPRNKHEVDRMTRR